MRYDVAKAVLPDIVLWEVREMAVLVGVPSENEFWRVG